MKRTLPRIVTVDFKAIPRSETDMTGQSVV
jgi:hypothetical protein